MRMRVCIAAALLLLAACAPAPGVQESAQPTGDVHAASTAQAQVVIPGADRFAPFVTTVRDGSAIVFRNGDSDAHTVVSVPGDPARFDKVLQPGQTWTLTLGAGGSYRYYCSIHARYNAATAQVEALPNADDPAAPMQGVVVVET